MPFFSVPSGGRPVFAGNGAPASSLGIVGDLYIDKENEALYGPKTAEGWGDPIDLASGGSSFDQSLNTTDSVEFVSVAMPNTSTLAGGSFDNGTGGNGGISLNCVVGYELNWQGGHMRCTADGGTTTADITIDSPIMFPGNGIANMKIDATGITFPDGTTLSTSSFAYITAPESPTSGDVLTYDSSTTSWIAAAPGGGSLPGGTEGYVLTYTNGEWIAAQAFSIGSGNNEGDVPTWSNSQQAYVPQQPSSGSSVFKGEWSSGASYSVGDFVEYSGVIYKSINANANPNPDTDPNYWVPIGGGGGGTSSWKGEWDSMESYTVNDVVVYGQALYLAVNTSQGTTPGTDFGSYWVALTGGGGGGSGLPSSPSDGALTVYSSTQMSWTTSGDSMSLSEIVLGSYGNGASQRAVVSMSPSDSVSPSIKVYDSMGSAFTELMSTGIKFADGTTQGSAFTGGYTGTFTIYDGSVYHYFEFVNGVLTNYSAT